jgi:hypothetical protein
VQRERDAANARAEAAERDTEVQRTLRVDAETRCSLASARIAELETLRAENNSDNRALREKLTTANARAEAAERNARHCVECMVQAESAADAAESESAALRAEAERLTKMLDVCNAVHGHNVKLKARLAAAHALLADIAKSNALLVSAPALHKRAMALAAQPATKRAHDRDDCDNPDCGTCMFAAQPATAPADNGWPGR